MIDEVLTVSPGSDRLPGRHRDGTRDGKRTREENRGHRRQDRYSRPSRMNGRVSQLMSGWRPGVTRPVLIVQAGNAASVLGYAGFAFVDRPWQAIACSIAGGAGASAWAC
jgi:hypothetical protein